MSGQEVAPVPSEQTAGVPGGSGSRVCLRHVLRQLVDDRERRPPALLGAVQLAQGPVGRGSSFSVSAVALCTLSCPPRGGPAEGQRGLEAREHPPSGERDRRQTAGRVARPRGVLALAGRRTRARPGTAGVCRPGSGLPVRTSRAQTPRAVAPAAAEQSQRRRSRLRHFLSGDFIPGKEVCALPFPWSNRDPVTIFPWPLVSGCRNVAGTVTAPRMAA